MIKTWQPLLDRLLVLQDWGPMLHPDTGLIIPEPIRAKQRPNTGTIVAVGPGQYINGTFCPVALKKGQHVMFAPAETLTPVEHTGVEHLMMREVDVFLVLNEPDSKLINEQLVRRAQPLTPSEAFGPEDAGALGPMHDKGSTPPYPTLPGLDSDL